MTYVQRDHLVNIRTRIFGSVVGVVSAILVALALTPFRSSVNNTNVALVLVLVVIVVSMRVGQFAGICTALAAAVSFDFLHTKPYESFTINSRNDLVTTLLLLVIALAAAQITLWVKHKYQAVKYSHAELVHLHHIAEFAASGASDQEMISAVTDALTELFDLQDCRFNTSVVAVGAPQIEYSGALRGSPLHSGNDEFVSPEQGVAMPVEARGRAFGQIILMPKPQTEVSAEQRVTAIAMADLLALVLAGGEKTI